MKIIWKAARVAGVASLAASTALSGSFNASAADRGLMLLAQADAGQAPVSDEEPQGKKRRKPDSDSEGAGRGRADSRPGDADAGAKRPSRSERGAATDGDNPSRQQAGERPSANGGDRRKGGNADAASSEGSGNAQPAEPRKRRDQGTSGAAAADTPAETKRSNASGDDASDRPNRQRRNGAVETPTSNTRNEPQEAPRRSGNADRQSKDSETPRTKSDPDNAKSPSKPGTSSSGERSDSSSDAKVGTQPKVKTSVPDSSSPVKVPADTDSAKSRANTEDKSSAKSPSRPTSSSSDTDQAAPRTKQSRTPEGSPNRSVSPDGADNRSRDRTRSDSSDRSNDGDRRDDGNTRRPVQPSEASDRNGDAQRGDRDRRDPADQNAGRSENRNDEGKRRDRNPKPVASDVQTAPVAASGLAQSDARVQDLGRQVDVPSIRKEAGERVRDDRRGGDDRRRSDRRDDDGRRGGDRGRDDRRDLPPGAKVVERVGDRDIVSIIGAGIAGAVVGGAATYFVRGNDDERIARDADDHYVERLAGGRQRDTVVRDNGVQVITITNRYGDVIQRSRVMPDGREVVLFYDPNQEDLDRPNYYTDPGADLPPLQVTIPQDRYIVDTTQPDEDLYYQTIVAPPVETVERIYSIDEVRRSERIRDKVRRIDLSTVNFDTGSDEITQDQASSLQALAEAVERVVDQNPDETFLIEGHTDAVGNEVDNLALSDRRAEAVASALTQYYNIPPENLITQGYGEQDLKVDTDGPSRENRRVTLRRITALVKPVNAAQR